MFVIFAVPSGLLATRFGKRRIILIGIAGLFVLFLYGLAVSNQVMLIILLVLAGFFWALINVNSLPMVVDMTEDVRIGTYTGLYYLFSTLAAIAGPNINGWIVQLTNNNYNNIMLIAPLFMFLALLAIMGVRRGEAKKAA
jgi:MFS family permease